MKPRILNTARLSFPLASAIAAMLAAPLAQAAPYTWTNATAATLDWTVGGNWSSGQFVSDPANELMFFSDSTTNLSGNRSITTNVPATLSMNTLTLNGRGFSSGAVTYTTTIASSASTWTIGDGTTSTFNLNANFGATAAAGYNTTVAPNLTLNQTTTLFTGSGTGGFTFSGAIGQAATGYGITKSGTSAATLSGALNFTGGITVSDGTLTLSNNTNSASTMTVNGGTLILTGNNNPPSASMTVNTGAILRIGNATTTQFGPAGIYSGNISTGTGGTLQLWSSSTQEFSGIISGSGGINKAYGGTLTLSGANTYTGKTQFRPQTTAGFTANVSSFDYITSGTWSNHGLGSSLGAPTTIPNGTIDLGEGGKAASVNLTYTGAAALGETTDRVINLGFNAAANLTVQADNSSGVLRFTSAFLSNTGTTGQLILRGTGAGQIDQGLPQIANGGLNKNDSGTWTLGGSGSFTGPTIITAGTLSLSSATALQFSPFNTASALGGAAAGLKIAATTLSLGGLTGVNSLASRFHTASSVAYSGLTDLTLTTAANSTSVYSGGIADTTSGLTVTKNGAGTQFLNGTNSYTGLTNVNAGALGSSGAFSGAVTVGAAGLAPGASAGAIGTLTISDATASALTLNGSNLLVDLSTASNDLIAVTGTTVLNGTNLILPNPTTGVAAGTYTIMTYGAKTGTGSVLFGNGTNTLGNATLAVNAGNIQMTVGAGGLNNSLWTGTSGTWDAGTNWNRNGVAAQAFVAGDFVTFDDTGTTLTVTSAATVSPTSVTVNNTTKAYTISATIGGTGTPLVKLGSNTLTLSGTNTYTGGTFIGGGRVGIVANANLGDAAGAVTFNGGELYVTNVFSSARSLILNNVAGNQILFQGNANWTNSGALTGDGGITLRQNPNGATTANFTSASNDFKGALGLQSNNGQMIVKLRSLADTASANGNIVYGLISASTNSPVFEWDSAAGGVLTLDNRKIEFAGDGTAFGTVRNAHTTNAITINTNLVNTGTGVKTLILEAVNGPTNVFKGIIGDGTGTLAVTKAGTAGVWVLSGNNSYTGATTVSSGTLAAIGANAFGSTSGISLTSTNTLSLRGDSSTVFGSSNVTTSATGPTINVNQATIAGTGAKTMTMGTLGTTSTAATYQVNFTGANNTSLSTGAVTGSASTAVAAVTLSNAIASTGELTLASYTSANTTGGETLTFSGSGNTTVTGNVTPSATTLSISKTSTGNVSLNGTSNTFTGGITLSAASSGTLSYSSAVSTVPITFSATTQFGAGVSYTGSTALTMSGLITASALTTGGISIDANGTSPTATINYSNAASLSTTSTGISARFINLGGSNVGDNTFAGAINNNTGVGGNTQLSKSGAGKWVLTGNSNFSGGFFLNQGTVSVDSIPNGGTTSPLGAVTRLNLGRDNNDGTLIYTGSGDSTNRDIRLGGPSTASGTGGSTILNNGTTGALTFTATNFNPTQTGILFNRTLTLGGSNTGGVNEIQGIIQNNTASTGLVNVEKSNASTWKLSGANTYTGTTTVSAGTLSVTGSLGATAVSVNAGTLSGNGNIGGDVSIASGATHALAVAATPGAQLTRAITGTLTLTAGNILDLTAASTPAAGEYVLATATTAITGTPTTINYNGITGVVSIDTVSTPKRLLLTVSAGTPYDTWSNGTFTNAFTDKLPANNQDGDTLTNLQEFAFGTDPTVSSESTITWSGGAVTGHGKPVILEESGTYYAVFGRRVSYVADGLTYTLRFSADLSSPWNVSGATPTVFATDGTIEAVKVPFPGLIPTDSGPQKARFFDARVSQ